MTKYKIKWKDVYFDITKKLLRRGGGSAVGHHTLPVKEIIIKLHPRYNKEVVEEGIERLIEKDDLLLWPRASERLKESSSVSINPGHFDDLERYLKGHPDWYKRLKDMEEEMGYEPD